MTIIYDFNKDKKDENDKKQLRDSQLLIWHSDVAHTVILVLYVLFYTLSSILLRIFN